MDLDPDQIVYYVFAYVALFAGVAKFLNPELYYPYQPEWIDMFIQKPTSTYLAGAIEVLGGLALVAKFRPQIISGLATIGLMIASLMNFNSGEIVVGFHLSAFAGFGLGIYLKQRNS